jgi:hypothetical protein
MRRGKGAPHDCIRSHGLRLLEGLLASFRQAVLGEYSIKARHTMNVAEEAAFGDHVRGRNLDAGGNIGGAAGAGT